MRSEAKTPEEYVGGVADHHRDLITAIRDVVLANLPDGYEEAMNWGMLSYQVPFERYPKTYNGQPLAYAALAAQKNYVSLYLMSVYGDDDAEEWFDDLYRASGKKLDMGKSCVRFKTLEDVPLDVIGTVIGRFSVDAYLARYEAIRAG